MRRESTFSTVVQCNIDTAYAFVSDLARLEEVHPLLERISLEGEENGVRVWRCEDRIMGFKLVYFAHQVLDPEAPGFTSRVSKSGLALENRWSFEATDGGTRISERMIFEGSPLVVWLSQRLGRPAHVSIFERLPAVLGQSSRT